MPARNRNWPGFSIDRLLDAAGNSGRLDPQLEALSNLVAAQQPDAALVTKGRCASYWLPANRAQLRALTAGSATGGGNLIAASMVAPLIEAARPLSVLVRAGARVVEVQQGNSEYVIPHWNEATAGTWLAEGADATSASLSVGTSSATPKLLGSRVRVSRRLRLQSIQPIEEALLNELGRSNLAVMEQGFWTGSGSESEPLGILNLPNVQTQSWAGATPTYSELVSMVDKYMDQEGSFERMTFFTHPATLAALMTQEVASGTGQFVAGCIHGPRQFSLFGIPVFATSAITEGKVALLDPTRVHVVAWNAPQLLIDTVTNGKSISGGAEIVLLSAIDLVVVRPSEVVVGG